MSVTGTYTCDRCRTSRDTKAIGEESLTLWRLIRIHNVWGQVGLHHLGEVHLCPPCTKGLHEYLESNREPSEEL